MENLKVVGIAAVTALVAVLVVAPQLPKQVVQQLSAVASPDVISPYLTWGGVRHWAGEDTLSTASTTVCSIQSPAATSTLVFASFKLTTGSTTGAQFEMGKDLTSYAATTTRLALQAVGAGALTTTFSTTTTDTSVVFGPSEYLNVKYGGSGTCVDGGTCNTYVGSCKAVWIQN